MNKIFSVSRYSSDYIFFEEKVVWNDDFTLLIELTYDFKLWFGLAIVIVNYRNFSLNFHFLNTLGDLVNVFYNFFYITKCLFSRIFSLWFDGQFIWYLLILLRQKKVILFFGRIWCNMEGFGLFFLGFCIAHVDFFRVDLKVMARFYLFRQWLKKRRHTFSLELS